MLNAYEDLLDQSRDLNAILSQVKVPTCIIGGTRDAIFTVEDYQKTAEALSNAKLILIEGAGHMMETVKQSELRAKIKPLL